MSTPTPTTEPPKRGTTVYDLYGTVAQVQQALPDGSLLVGVMFEGIDYDSRGEERTIDFEGPLQVWHKWFLRPPVQKKAEEVTAMEKQVSDLRTDLQKLRAEKAAEMRKADDRMRFLKQHEGLQRLDDYLSLKITHILYLSWDGVQIIDTTQWEKLGRKSCSEGLRLLTLYGKTNGELNWRLGEYSDHSGGSYQAYPFTSKEEALAKAQEIANEKFAAYLDNGNNYSDAERIIAFCQEYGLTITEGVESKMQAIREKNLQQNIESKRREIQALEAQIANPAPEEHA